MEPVAYGCLTGHPGDEFAVAWFPTIPSGIAPDGVGEIGESHPDMEER
jgi:hypothetical protein